MSTVCNQTPYDSSSGCIHSHETNRPNPRKSTTQSPKVVKRIKNYHQAQLHDFIKIYAAEFFYSHHTDHLFTQFKTFLSGVRNP